MERWEDGKEEERRKKKEMGKRRRGERKRRWERGGEAKEKGDGKEEERRKKKEMGKRRRREREGEMKETRENDVLVSTHPTQLLFSFDSCYQDSYLEFYIKRQGYETVGGDVEDAILRLRHLKLQQTHDRQERGFELPDPRPLSIRKGHLGHFSVKLLGGRRGEEWQLEPEELNPTEKYDTILLFFSLKMHFEEVDIQPSAMSNNRPKLQISNTPRYELPAMRWHEKHKQVNTI
ncbi:hypothetical protein H6P81_006349 [Aristolochia fimbriata]|uniref:Uncharacterized protein n=1 Tax=Aristolochia fimbriata TaxID=158543 RepID=A0AAV7EZ90_ARIFI|nr:hypothetical protein H6P81_006349 [Aristolochia fimbriata]